MVDDYGVKYTSSLTSSVLPDGIFLSVMEVTEGNDSDNFGSIRLSKEQAEQLINFLQEAVSHV